MHIIVVSDRSDITQLLNQIGTHGRLSLEELRDVYTTRLFATLVQARGGIAGVVVIDMRHGAFNPQHLFRDLRRSQLNIPILGVDEVKEDVNAFARRQDAFIVEGGIDLLPFPLPLHTFLAVLQDAARNVVASTRIICRCRGHTITIRSLLMRVWVNGYAVDLTPIEYALIARLAQRPHDCIPKNELAKVLQEDSGHLTEIVARIHNKFAAIHPDAIVFLREGSQGHTLAPLC